MKPTSLRFARVRRTIALALVSAVAGGCKAPSPCVETVAPAPKAVVSQGGASAAPTSAPSPRAVDAAHVSPRMAGGHDGGSVDPSQSLDAASARRLARPGDDPHDLCSLTLPHPYVSIEQVPSSAVAWALVPSLDPRTMRADVVKGAPTPDDTTHAAVFVKDCKGHLSPARWEDHDGVPSRPDGVIEVIGRKTFPGNIQAVWVATSAEVGACTQPDGFGLLALVTVEGDRLRVLGVSLWNPECGIQERNLRAERLGHETVYVEEVHFDTGGGAHDSTFVWTLRGGVLQQVGGVETREGGGLAEGTADDAGIYQPASLDARLRFVGDDIVVTGESTWYRPGTSDGGGPTNKVVATERWVERYVIRDGKLVLLTVPPGAPRRPSWMPDGGYRMPPTGSARAQ